MNGKTFYPMPFKLAAPDSEKEPKISGSVNHDTPIPKTKCGKDPETVQGSYEVKDMYVSSRCDRRLGRL